MIAVSYRTIVFVISGLSLFETLIPSPARADEPESVVFLKQWGQQGKQPGEFHFPIAIAVNEHDQLFVTDHLNHRVQKFDTEGKLLGQIPVLPNPGGKAGIPGPAHTRLR